MDNKILNTIEKHKMLSSDSVLIALSGGADSMVLLYFFNKYQQKLGIKLNALHLNHNIRGSEALRDQNFVENYCKKIGVPLTVYSKDIPKLALQSGESIEECGRRLRYELLFGFNNSSMIATGHHLDDSAESALFNLIRGTGIAGLRGILPVRDRLIRPLINCSKKEILSYCKEHEIPFVEDSTNQDTSYSRNNIRENLIPIFKEINPEFLSSFSRNAEILSLYEKYIGLSVDELLADAKTDEGYSIKALQNAHPALRRAALANIAKDISGKSCEYRHIQAIEEILKDGGKVTLPNNMQVWAISDHLFAPSENDFPSQKPTFAEVNISDFNDIYNIYEKTVLFGKIEPQIHNKSQKINNKVFNNLIDYDTIQGNVVLRGRKSGDSVRLFSRGCTKSLKKLFNEAKTPIYERDRLLILADDRGIIWLEGFGVCERCAVSEKTKKTIKIEIKAKGRQKNNDR